MVQTRPSQGERRKKRKGYEDKELKILLTFAVVAEAHLGLTKTDGVLAGANAIELLQLSLLHILYKAIVSVNRRREKVKP